MPDVFIENPVLNSPFAEPSRHFRFDDQGITSAFAIGRGPRSGVGVGVVPLDHHRLRVRAPLAKALQRRVLG